MERMWASWRMAYVGAKPARGCILCRLGRSRRAKEGWIVATPTATTAPQAPTTTIGAAARPAVTTTAPAPRVHPTPAVVHDSWLHGYPAQEGWGGLLKEERADLMELVERTERAIVRAYRPSGLNLGVNLGRCAGAGVPGHLHVHVLPRWDGDTNFMPALAETKVLPESLPATWKRLRAAFKEEA